MSIGEKLLKLRKEKGYSQEEVAEKLGVTRQTISKWETDQSSPDFDKIVPLCSLYGISADELLTGNKSEMSNVDHKEHSNRKSTAKVISISIFLYFLSIISIILSEEVFHLSDGVTVSVFLFICGIATVMLVYHFTALPKRKEERIVQPSVYGKHDKKYKAIVSVIASIFTIVYLAVSFMTMAWHITWIIWLVYSVVVEIVKLMFLYKEENND